MYALVDCNNFYVSCERVFQPQYNNKPVIVLSNNDGCAISRSDEAKALGIPMGAPEFKYRDLIATHQVKVFSSNYALYGDLSSRVMKILQQFAPNVEIYSIDEAFLNYQGTTINFEKQGFDIKTRIQQWLSIPVCVGFAPTKALAKVSNRIAKKFKERTNGVYVINTEEKRIKALKWTKIEDVWGIGYQFAKKMRTQNIVTAFDFTLPHNEKFIQKTMGVVGLRLRLELLGQPVLAIDEPKDKKNIAVTRSFEKTMTSLTDLKERISTFATICAEKLRAQQSVCQIITVFIKLDKYANLNQPYSFYTLQTLPFASNSNLTLSNAAIVLLEQLYKPNFGYKKAGVIVSQILPENQKQLHLFVEENPKHAKLMQVIDAIQKKTGERKIRLANQDLNRTWKMKQNYLSKKYTTNFNDILQVKCQ